MLHTLRNLRGAKCVIIVRKLQLLFKTCVNTYVEYICRHLLCSMRPLLILHTKGFSCMRLQMYCFQSDVAMIPMQKINSLECWLLIRLFSSFAFTGNFLPRSKGSYDAIAVRNLYRDSRVELVMAYWNSLLMSGINLLIDWLFCV